MFYTSKLKVDTKNAQINVEIADALNFDPLTGNYFSLSASDVKDSVLTTSSGTCSCSGMMKEVHYTVKLVTPTTPPANSNGKVYRIESIKATPVIYSNFVAQGDCKSKQSINQRFSIKFVYGEDQGQSKNPGYVAGQPLLIG